jgi:Ca-activated chloride channel family protein
MDLSGSVLHKFGFEQQAAIRFLKKIWRTGDSVSIVTFGEAPTARLRYSPSLPDALQTLADLQPSESATAFFDALTLSARLLRNAASPDSRQAVIVFSDGEDNRSDCTLTDALMEVQHSDLMLYAINPGGSSIRLNDLSLRGQQDLLALANPTGGSVFVWDESGDLDPIFAKIAAELRFQYLLRYYSSDPKLDGGYKRIAVSLPQKPELRIRARHGYYASKK